MTFKHATLARTAAVATIGLLSACGAMSSMAYDQSSLPAEVKVPSGNRVAWETVGRGDITYECKANKAGQPEWTFAGPDAVLEDRMGKQVGKYYGPPATWEAMDGSKITGTQVAVAPAGTGNLPYQLVKANPAMGNGAMTGVTYVQRVALKGGVAPMSPACTSASMGQRTVVKYQADYIFWKAN
ncbi:Protein of uncharacterised function (DUF3455) [Bordetella ansorpii]|uniref:Protein of uncharacterized function (DUF3455) n=1 Tax=Bordetella ansorpii TaxID=288768 RepID=A0A157SG77_9BORD|nr:DUF3455 domain-containing protein [Bordetella ansorpii]SAI69435.1 Protein of uncharacterised function (DUF3455) [Bordetella ansorpii]